MYIFIPNLVFDLKVGWLNLEDARHLHSLHPKVDDCYTFTNLKGEFALGKIVEINKKLTSYKIQFGEVNNGVQLEEKILFQHQTDKLYLEKLVELAPIAGITKIFLCSGDFSPKQNISLERLNKILIRSCEQSHNLFLPEIIVLNKNDWQHQIKKYRPIWLHQNGSDFKNMTEHCFEYILQNGLNNQLNEDLEVNPRNINNGIDNDLEGVSKPGFCNSCLVGPEGGFSKIEEEYYEKLKLLKINMGQNILPAWLAGYTFFLQNFG